MGSDEALPRRPTMRGPRRKRPRVRRPGAGQVACGLPRRSKLEARDFPYVASRRASRQSTKMRSYFRSLAEPGVIRRREQSTCRSKSRSWQARLVQGSISSVIKRSNRLATDDGTKGAPNNLSTAVFGRRKSTVSVMARKINRVDDPHRSGRPDKRESGGAAREESPEAPNAERTAGDQVMLDQGLRLNRAFISINDSLVREAIVNLVVEAAMSPPSDALRRVRSSTSLREAPTPRRPRM
jgi:hypothetical protein